jgi:hypothetical protein
MQFQERGDDDVAWDEGELAQIEALANGLNGRLATQRPAVGHNGGPPLSNKISPKARSEPPADDSYDNVARAISAIPEKLRLGARQRAHMKIAKQGRSRTACGRAVFDALLERLNWSEGQARPGYDRLRQDTGFSRRAIISSIGHLEHGREVLVKRPAKADGRTANRYTLPPLVPEIALCTSVPNPKFAHSSQQPGLRTSGSKGH